MVVRVNADGSLTTVAAGLTFPSAITFDPDVEEIYIWIEGYGVPVVGAGQIVRMDVG